MRSVVCPKKWDGVSLGKFMAYAEMMADEGEDSERMFAAISIMTGADVDEVKRWSMATFQKVWATLAFLQSDIKGKIPKLIKVGKSKYDIVTNPKRLTYGAFCDLMHFVKDEKTARTNLHHAFACCLVKRGRWPLSKSVYDGAEHTTLAEAIKLLPITQVKPATDFFLRNYLTYSKNMVVYLEMKRKGLKRRADSMRSSGGLMLSIL